MKKYSRLMGVNMLLAVIFLYSCQKENNELTAVESRATSAHSKRALEPGFAENDMVMYWNEKVATVLGGGIQPARARYFAIIQIAVHDALNNIKPKYQRYALLNERSQFASPDAAVASAAYWAIKGLNRQGNFPVDTWYNESLSTIPDGESKELGKSLGKHAADSIIANRAGDGFTQVIQTSVTTPPDGDEPGEYRSTLIFINGILSPTTIKRIPNWGIVVKPFVTESNYQFRPEAPYEVNSENYTDDYNEVKTKGARVGGNRSADEEMMARFWSENRPSFTWNNFTREVIKSKKLDAWKTARLFALVHVSMADAINSQMNAGYHFYFWRPETGIRLADTDGNDNTEADVNWLPFLNEATNVFGTPPVPGYPNGFAAYGGAATGVLRSFFASDETSISLNSATLPGQTMHFSTFSQAARENSLSMIYTGWDFRKSALVGEEMGRQIGEYVFNHHFGEVEE